jgi:hypothetical protein
MGRATPLQPEARVVDAARRHSRALVAAALAVAAAVVVIVLALPREHAEPLLRTTQPIAARTSFSPGEHLFGDSSLARLEVVVNRALVDPDSVRVAASFKPYRIEGPVIERRTGLEGGTRLEFDYHIRCLTRPCVPQGKPRRDFAFPNATVAYVQQGLGPRADAVGWPRLEVVSRIRPADTQERKFADALDSLPAATYRLGPDALTALLLGLALALVFGTGAVVAYRLRGPAPPPEPARTVVVRALSPLEQALALLDRALAGLGSDEQRKALERLGRELVARGRPDLAAVARRLAWSRTGPSVADARALSEEVEHELLDAEAEHEADEESAPREHALAGGM